MLVLAPRASAQLSPGPLARPHRGLEGALNCTSCHSPRRQSMSALCSDCHREIAWLAERQRGFHASVAAVRKECAECHPDHAGAGFELIAWPDGSPDKFRHASAGWKLEGSHGDLRCGDCHASKFRTSPAAALSRRRDGSGWVGLETACASCHRDDDAHRGALEAACDRCHDTREWTPAPRFDHDETSYPLSGKHERVDCADCHETSRVARARDAYGEAIPVYKPLAFQSCADCHSDPHNGRLSKSCGECHTTAGFESVPTRGFNHELTRYPLRGKHGRASCASCHGVNLAVRQPAFAECRSCHRDPHEGESRLARVTDCASCHTVAGFAPSSYDVEKHRLSAYPLEGRHTQVSCGKCHQHAAGAGGVGVRLRMPFSSCGDCHADAHAGQFAARPNRGVCESCHAVSGFSPSTFGVSQHALLELPLDGRHSSIGCSACHSAAPRGFPPQLGSGALGTARVALALPRSDCASCHVDAHDSRYSAGPGARADCRECHSTTAFRPSLVDTAAHRQFGFSLEGAHLAVSCAGCHRELSAPAATNTLVLSAKGVVRFPASTGTRGSCASCHDSPHGDQFNPRQDTGACESCHSVTAFAPAQRFDHDKTRFGLRGAHQNVPCASCHRLDTTAGARRVVYRPLSTECRSCHDRRGTT
jgi:hypothetical protein